MRSNVGENAAIALEARAKINLFLDITGRRADGYHLLSTVMQEISLYDEVRLGRSEPCALVEKPTVVVNNWSICLTEGFSVASKALGLRPRDNLMVRAAALYAEACALSSRQPLVLTLDLVKHLPSMAGIGGGSADAAAVLNGLDSLFPGELERGELFEIAARLGADVPFCLHGGVAHCTGIGEIIEPLPPLPKWPLLLIKPDVEVSTVMAFKRWDELIANPERLIQRPDTVACLEALAENDLRKLRHIGGNVFETVVAPEYPELRQLLQAGYDTGASYCRMTGSGSAIYAIYEDEATRDRAIDRARWEQSAAGRRCDLYPCNFV